MLIDCPYVGSRAKGEQCIRLAGLLLNQLVSLFYLIKEVLMLADGSSSCRVRLGLAASGGVPAHIGNRYPQFSILVELAGGDDETVLVEQRSHKNLAVRAC